MADFKYFWMIRLRASHVTSVTLVQPENSRQPFQRWFANWIRNDSGNLSERQRQKNPWKLLLPRVKITMKFSKNTHPSILCTLNLTTISALNCNLFDKRPTSSDWSVIILYWFSKNTTDSTNCMGYSLWSQSYSLYDHSSDGDLPKNSKSSGRRSPHEHPWKSQSADPLTQLRTTKIILVLMTNT